MSPISCSNSVVNDKLSGRFEFNDDADPKKKKVGNKNNLYNLHQTMSIDRASQELFLFSYHPVRPLTVSYMEYRGVCYLSCLESSLE